MSSPGPSAKDERQGKGREGEQKCHMGDVLSTRPGRVGPFLNQHINGQNFATYLQGRMGNVIPILATHSGSFIEEGEVTDTEAIMLQLHILVTFQYQWPHAGKVKGAVFSVFTAPAFFLLLLLLLTAEADLFGL